MGAPGPPGSGSTAGGGHRLSLDRIVEASELIDPVFTNTPQYQCDALSEALGCTLTLKVEICNPIRCFKGRGADYFVSRVVARGDDRPMVCASAGNFGQALAYACRKHGRPLTVFAAVSASPVKIDRMRALGAEVRLEGDDFDSAKAAARRSAAGTGAWMIEDGLEPEISEGAGTMGLELLRHAGVHDEVVVPVGNGAMLNGVARWLKAASPTTRVVGLCSVGADATARSFRAGTVVTGSRVETIADGIAVRVPIPEAVADMRGLVDEILLVDDDAVIAGMKLLHRHAGLVVEPAGAVGIAGLLAHRERFAGERVATIVCGGNLSEEQVRRWIHGDPGGGRS